MGKNGRVSFIEKLVKNKRLIFPLAGHEERAGDAVFSSEHRWLLIEFKRSVGSIRDEMRKFDQYDAAKAELKGQDAHHFLIYGWGTNDQPQRLDLAACTYFGRIRPKSIEVMLSAGIEFDVFTQYVERFTGFKKKGGRSSVGGLAAEQLGLVAGINADGTVVECLSLQEFQRRRELRLEQTNAQEYDLPAPGR